MEIIIWLVICGVVGAFASNKGRSGFGWFLLAFLISPLLGGLILAMTKDLSQERNIDQIKKDNEKLEDRVVYGEKINDMRFKKIEERINSEIPLPTGIKTELLEEAFKDCPICGRGIYANAKRCKHCKNDLSRRNLKKCKHCREIVPKQATICTHCQSKI